MVNTISLKALRPELPEVIKGIDEKFNRYVVTKHGKPVVVMMSMDDYEGLLETIEILSDKQTVRRIKKAESEFKAGKGISLEALKKRLTHV